MSRNPSARFSILQRMGDCQLCSWLQLCSWVQLWSGDRSSRNSLLLLTSSPWSTTALLLGFVSSGLDSHMVWMCGGGILLLLWVWARSTTAVTWLRFLALACLNSQPNLVVAGGHNNNACPLGGAHLVETTRINLVVRTFSIQLSIFWCQTSFVNDVTISYFVHIVSCSVSRNPVYTVHLFPIGLFTNCVRCHKKVIW